MTPARIIDAARIDLKDNFKIEFRRWPDEDLFTAIEIGIEEISNAYPIMTQTTAEVKLAPGVYQEIPADWKKFIRIELNSLGLPVFQVDRDASNAYYAHRPQEPSSAIEEYWTDIKVDRSFYVNPPANDNTTAVIQGALRQPKIESMEQPLVLIDDAIGMIVHYVLYIAYRKDAEVAEARGVSEWYYNKWRQDLGLKAAMDAIASLPAGLMAGAIAQVQAPGLEAQQ